MPSAIGIRVYKFAVHERGKTNPIPLEDLNLSVVTPDFIDRFIDNHDSAVQNNELERSWHFQERNKDNPGCSQGYVHYGTFGFESSFVDTKTKKHNYRRQTTDVEIIPLFYELWCPKGSDFGLMAFQSFQGRSCIQLVLTSMKKEFESLNPHHAILFKKLMPSDAKGTAYYSAPVKQLRLIKRKAPSDLADKYFSGAAAESFDFEIKISARKSGSLGSLSSLMAKVKNGEKSAIIHSGISFPEAIAEVKVGKKLRRVGVIGFNGDAGVIDVTDEIKRGLDGHPTFESLAKESDEILRDFYETIAGAL